MDAFLTIVGFMSTLKAIIIASEAFPSNKSLSVIPPIPFRTIFTFTLGKLILLIAAAIASQEPYESALTMKFSLISPVSPINTFHISFMLYVISALFTANKEILRRSLRFAAASFADCSSITIKSSPALGTSWKPIICTGIAGPADFISFPCQSLIDLTLPYEPPATNESPLLSVPFLMITVAIAPQFLSIVPSSMTPDAFGIGFAFNSSISAFSRIRSINSGKL